MQNPSSVLGELLLSDAAPRSICCSRKIVAVVSLLTVLAVTLVLNPLPHLAVQEHATTLAAQNMPALKGLRSMQIAKVWHPLKSANVRHLPVAAPAFADAQDVAKPEPALSRRQTNLAGLLGGLVMVLSQSSPAWSEEYVDGPDGLKYVDVKVGDGEEVAQGSTVTVDYTFSLVNDGSEVGEREDFDVVVGKNKLIKGFDASVLGKASMAPMRQGGVRQIIIPKELAYGNENGACVSRGGTTYCKVPKRSSLKLLVKVKEVKKR
eukprot:gnl/TRDRNA2_/TRDRNA2_29761_c0_seq1.p1 gnl/TRDRNA2_/TRDRNA2_29761_c0~~gnl/TRDRNA2_/TRDRNA2_29761_c0_seq1.p1  ORF type:complete len:264 (-),score=45.93 gnl/TRDRNA2_/TRDRNA2_29761_c0_seq1:94-885(-)